MNRDERQELLKVLEAHAQTVAICEACATTTRDLAAEVARGGIPSREDLMATVAEADRTLKDLARVREEVERLYSALAAG
jgi:sulfur relay (sulfurtransferase) complex TusBCD TusD component (DsrE family)